MASRIEGAKALRRALRAAPQHLRDEALEGVADHAASVHAQGLANMDAMITARTGLARRSYRRRVMKKSLRASVGYLTRLSRRRVRYIRFVHDGTVDIDARPFHDLAVRAGARRFQTRMRAVMRKALRKTFGARLR